MQLFTYLIKRWVKKNICTEKYNSSDEEIGKKLHFLFHFFHYTSTYRELIKNTKERKNEIIICMGRKKIDKNTSQ